MLKNVLCGYKEMSGSRVNSQLDNPLKWEITLREHMQGSRITQWGRLFITGSWYPCLDINALAPDFSFVERNIKSLYQVFKDKMNTFLVFRIPSGLDKLEKHWADSLEDNHYDGIWEKHFALHLDSTQMPTKKLIGLFG